MLDLFRCARGVTFRLRGSARLELLVREDLFQISLQQAAAYSNTPA